MQTLNLGFMISSIIVAFFCLFFDGIRLHHTQHHRIYKMGTIIGLISAIMDFLASYLSLTSKNTFWLNTTNNIYFLIHSALPPLFVAYIFTLSGKGYSFTRKQYYLFFLPFILLESCIICNIISPGNLLFMYDHDGNYMRGPLAYLVYADTVFYFIAIMITMYKTKDLFLKKNFNVLVNASIISIIGLIIQALFVSIRIELLSEAIACIGLLLSIENREMDIDQDTGLFNHKIFLYRINSLLKLNTHFELLSLRISNIKDYETLLSREEYQSLIMHIASFIQSLLLHNELGYYYDDGLFVIILFHNNVHRVGEILRRIQERMNKPFYTEHNEILVQSLIGSGSFPNKIKSLEAIQYILENTYSTTHLGCHYINYKILQNVYQEATLAPYIDLALKEHRFEVYFQPIIDLTKNRAIAGEALLRLKDEQGHYLNTEQVIRVAEKQGKIIAIGQQIFEIICQFISHIDMDALGLEYIEFNLSPAQLTYGQLTQSFSSILNKYHIDVKYLNMEITETENMDNSEMQEKMNDLKNLGFKFSLDDFGTGYSNLTRVFSGYYKNIKIDKSLLWESDGNKEQETILVNLIKSISQTDMSIIQEGVETTEQLERVQQAGAKMIQGYYFSKPLTANEFIDYLKRNLH